MTLAWDRADIANTHVLVYGQHWQVRHPCVCVCWDVLYTRVCMYRMCVCVCVCVTLCVCVYTCVSLWHSDTLSSQTVKCPKVTVLQTQSNGVLVVIR